MTQPSNQSDLFQRGIDGELTDAECEILERRLSENPDEAALYHEMQRHRDLITQAVPTPSKDHLRNLVKQAQPKPQERLRLAASVAIFAAGLGLGYAMPIWTKGDNSDLAAFAKHAQAAHSLYVSEVLHPVEVVASERAHLQSWLSNRLGAAIIAPRLGATGYTLIGGRLLPGGQTASALFMYENADGDRMSLLATYGATSQYQSFRFHKDAGFMTVSWQDGPWQYSLVGSQMRETLDEIAQEIHGQLI